MLASQPEMPSQGIDSGELAGHASLYRGCLLWKPACFSSVRDGSPSQTISRGGGIGGKFRAVEERSSRPGRGHGLSAQGIADRVCKLADERASCRRQVTRPLPRLTARRALRRWATSLSADQERTFSVHLGKNAFRCFQKDCRVQGNALDLWAAVHRLRLYDAALHLAETGGLPRNKEEEPVKGTR
jgi:hypothetical protein